MIEAVTKTFAATFYDGTNSTEALELVQSVLAPASGNVWAIVSEDENGLVLSEANAWFTINWLPIPANRWLVAEANNTLSWYTDEQFNALFTRYKDIFLAAANDPGVIDVLRTALGLEETETP